MIRCSVVLAACLFVPEAQEADGPAASSLAPVHAIHGVDRAASFEVTPIALATTDQFGPGGRHVMGEHGLLVPVRETDHGQTDLNGDGDTEDTVLAYYEFASGTSHNLGLAVMTETDVFLPSPIMCGPRFLFLVNEQAQGQRDRNGDGDAVDHVLCVFDPATGTSHNLAMASSGWIQADSRWGNKAVFNVGERYQGGTDLNGDGDAEDFLYFIYDTVTGEIANTGIASGYDSVFDGGRLLFPVPEWEEGPRDLNGDGDQLDFVAHLYDMRTGSLTNLGYPMSMNINLLFASALRARFAAFAVPEGAHGNQDLNGDGDTEDDVVVVHDLGTGETRVTSLATDPAGSRPFMDRGRLFVSVSEESQGGSDLNGDGDANDDVAFVHDLRTGASTNLGLAGRVRGITDSPFLTLAVSEEDQGGVDLNHDGDGFDTVFQIHNLVRGVTFNTALSGAFYPGWDAARDQILLCVDERYQGQADLNGDGDAVDTRVLHIADLARRTLTNVGIALELFWHLGAGHATGSDLVAFGASERFNNQDYDGDGETDHHVMHVYDLSTGTVHNLEVPANLYLNPVVSGNRALFLTWEPDGEDWNGDGDFEDQILMLATRIE